MGVVRGLFHGGDLGGGVLADGFVGGPVGALAVLGLNKTKRMLERSGRRCGREG